MTINDSALEELTGRLAGRDSELAMSIAQILQDAIQELIEAELTPGLGRRLMNEPLLVKLSATVIVPRR